MGVDATDATADAGHIPATAPEAGAEGGVEGAHDWSELGTANQCRFQRLAAPGGSPLFTWNTCQGVPDCEISAFGPLPPDQETDFEVTHFNQVDDDGTSTRASLLVSDKLGYLALVTDSAGRVLDEYRVRDETGLCDYCSVVTGLSNGHFGMLSQATSSSGRFGLLLVKPGQSATPTLMLPNGRWMAPVTLGESRWAEGYGSVSSFSNTTGDDPYVVTSVGGASNVRAAGSHFLFEKHESAAPSRIEITDGIVPGKPYLVPPDDSDYFAPAYAHSHVVWLHGIGRDALSGRYETVELLDSPFSLDPAKLIPERLADTTLDRPPYVYAGGWGRYVVATDSGTLTVWDVAGRTKRTFTLPLGVKLSAILGLTRHRLWVLANDLPNSPNVPDFIVRYALD